MFGASTLMLWPIKGKKANADATDTETDTETVAALIIAGIVVGLLAGLVGVGGGFLIVPALLLIAKANVKKAMATSLLIIALQSLAGFGQYAIYFTQNDQLFNWPLIMLVTGCALSGLILGGWIAEKLPQAVLKRIFAVALIPLCIFIFTTNI